MQEKKLHYQIDVVMFFLALRVNPFLYGVLIGK
jgi:hypothetical protein